MALPSPSPSTTITTRSSSSILVSDTKSLFFTFSSPKKLRSLTPLPSTAKSFPLSQHTHFKFPRFHSVPNSAITDVHAPVTVTDVWAEFAKHVSGEWDGFGADFSREGKPVELPENVVPDAFREWEVKVYDWQTQCPTLAKPEEQVLVYKTIKLLPTVGCEADAATRYSIDERSIGDVSSEASAFAYHSSGSYVALWPTQDKSFELEFCLVDPQDRESRVRLTQVVRVDDEKMALENIKVFCEQWYGEFRNGEQLGGCAIRDSAFASTPAMKASDVGGLWQGPISVAKCDRPGTKVLQELQEVGVQRSVREGTGLVLLPKQLWCSLEKIDGETCCEVGWLFDHGQAVTSRCIFSHHAKLKEIYYANETAISVDVEKQ